MLYSRDMRLRALSISLAGMFLGWVLTAQPKPETGKSILYTALDRDNISYATKKRLVQRVILKVTTLPDRPSMIKTATTIFTAEKTRWDEFRVSMLLPGMDEHTGAYGLADFTPAGLQEFTINNGSLLGTRWQKFYPGIGKK